MSEDLEFVQWGGTLDLGMLDDDEHEEIIDKMTDAGLRVGETPAEDCYYVRAWEDEK